MKVGRYFLFCFIFLSFTAFSQQEVTTPDSKKVLLYPDGTWKPAVPAKSSANLPIINLPFWTTQTQSPRPNHSSHGLYRVIQLNLPRRRLGGIWVHGGRNGSSGSTKQPLRSRPLAQIRLCIQRGLLRFRLRPWSPCTFCRYVLFLPNDDWILLPLERNAPSSKF